MLIVLPVSEPVVHHAKAAILSVRTENAQTLIVQIIPVMVCINTLYQIKNRNATKNEKIRENTKTPRNSSALLFIWYPQLIQLGAQRVCVNACPLRRIAGPANSVLRFKQEPGKISLEDIVQRDGQGFEGIH